MIGSRDSMKGQSVVVLWAIVASLASVGCRQGAAVADGGGSGRATGGAVGTTSSGGTSGSGGAQSSGGTGGSGAAGATGRGGTTGEAGRHGTAGSDAVAGSGGRGGITGAGGGTGGASGGGAGGGGIGPGGGTCSYGGTSYPVGASFPDADGCNTCGCDTAGEIACTARVCQPDAGTPPCELDMSYQFGMIGGRVSYQHRVTLIPARTYIHSRYSVPTGPYLSCSPALPACLSTAIDVSDVMRDIADPDVQKAFVTSPIPVYGIDPRLTDGPIFSLARDTGSGFQVGNPCGGASGCIDPPAGIARLVATLRALEQQQLEDPSCADLRADAF